MSDPQTGKRLALVPERKRCWPGRDFRFVASIDWDIASTGPARARGD
jgi:hypothetical protein